VKPALAALSAVRGAARLPRSPPVETLMLSRTRSINNTNGGRGWKPTVCYLIIPGCTSRSYDQLSDISQLFLFNVSLSFRIEPFILIVHMLSIVLF
jgi:hypothetical protein